MVIRRNKKKKKYRVCSESGLLRKARIKLYKKRTEEEFLKRYDTEEKCRDYLFRWKWPEGYRCRNLIDEAGSRRICGHSQFNYHVQRDLYACKECGFQASLTTDTIFVKTRTPLNEWFRMIIYIVREDELPSTRKLQDKLGIKSYDRALRMRKKIEGVLLGDTAYEQFIGIVERHILLPKQTIVKKLRAIKEREILEAADAERLSRQLERIRLRRKEKKPRKRLSKKAIKFGKRLLAEARDRLK